MATKKIQILGTLGGTVEVDTTLTQSGQAADAKAVGDQFNTYEFITAEDIDIICGTTIQMANEEGVDF